jgi:hypothetical protein
MESSTTNTLSFSRSEKRINRTDLAYIAGFLDGEGSINGHWKKPHNCVITRVNFYNTDRAIMIWIAERIGGRLYTVQPRLGTRVQYQLDIRTRDLKWFLKLMIPFLKVKSKQLRIALILLMMTKRKSLLTRKLKWLTILSALNKGKKIESVPLGD